MMAYDGLNERVLGALITSTTVPITSTFFNIGLVFISIVSAAAMRLVIHLAIVVICSSFVALMCACMGLYSASIAVLVALHSSGYKASNLRYFGADFRITYHPIP